MKYVIVDIETTGGNPKQSKVTDIALYKHDGNEMIDEYESLVNPEIPIPSFICQLTGITDKMVADAPKFHEIAKDIIEFTKDCVFVAHNVSFDYNVLRWEFKSLGFDYRRPHLCTVKAARGILPGHDSYSLGKLSRALGIEIIGRHRAGGDALATTKLFDILIKKSPSKLKSFLQEDINTSILNPSLNLNAIDDIPDKAGIYEFYDKDDQLLFLGKGKQIKKKINLQLRNVKNTKNLELIKEVTKIEYSLTGSEFIASFLELETLKTKTPSSNKTKTKFPYGIYAFENGYEYKEVKIGAVSKNQMTPFLLFSTKKEANEEYAKLLMRYDLCRFDNSSLIEDCEAYASYKCKGACKGKESFASYNERVDKMVADCTFKNRSFAVIENGRQKGEKSILIVENGKYLGYGFAPFHAQYGGLEKMKQYLETCNETEATLSRIYAYIQHLDQKNLFEFA